MRIVKQKAPRLRGFIVPAAIAKGPACLFSEVFFLAVAAFVSAASTAAGSFTAFFPYLTHVFAAVRFAALAGRFFAVSAGRATAASFVAAAALVTLIAASVFFWHSCVFF